MSPRKSGAVGESVSGWRLRSRLHLKSSAVIGLPSWKAALWRIVNRYVTVPSSLIVGPGTDSAKSGAIRKFAVEDEQATEDLDGDHGRADVGDLGRVKVDWLGAGDAELAAFSRSDGCCVDVGLSLCGACLLLLLLLNGGLALLPRDLLLLILVRLRPLGSSRILYLILLLLLVVAAARYEQNRGAQG